MEVYTQKRLLPEPPEEFVKRLTEWYDDGKQKGVIAMTENEAISELEKFQIQVEHSIAEEECCEYDNSEKEFQKDEKFLYAFDMAISALKEVQQFREMDRRLREVYGDCEGLLEKAVFLLCDHEGVDVGNPIKARLLTDEDVDKWEAYKSTGTVEECREAMKKTNPMKPEALDNDFDYYKCPVCGEYIWATDTINDHKYCLNCGQAIDWEESEGE